MPTLAKILDVEFGGDTMASAEETKRSITLHFTGRSGPWTLELQKRDSNWIQELDGFVDWYAEKHGRPPIVDYESDNSWDTAPPYRRITLTHYTLEDPSDFLAETCTQPQLLALAADEVDEVRAWGRSALVKKAGL